jgi:hypothetical protein
MFQEMREQRAPVLAGQLQGLREHNIERLDHEHREHTALTWPVPR